MFKNIYDPFEASQDHNLVILGFPGMTLQDFVGPITVLGTACRTSMLWKSNEPIKTDGGMAIMPTGVYADCPNEIDILMIPGGFGFELAIQDTEFMDFVRACVSRAKYITSVCTGSIILAAAGALEGYKAATYWLTYEHLEKYGVEGDRSRVCVDRNRITGGGVTAGLDFGLHLLALLKGVEMAEMTQLLIEYDPKPPFDSGSPLTASAATIEAAKRVFESCMSSQKELAIM